MRAMQTRIMKIKKNDQRQPSAAQSPVANWYTDPAGRSELRYWDGQKWTDHTQPPVKTGRFIRSMLKVADPPVDQPPVDQPPAPS